MRQRKPWILITSHDKNNPRKHIITVISNMKTIAQEYNITHTKSKYDHIALKDSNNPI